MGTYIRGSEVEGVHSVNKAPWEHLLHTSNASWQEVFKS